ncbi:MAG: hypothetical protein DRI24_18960 [Deltaproteobacteria bacterium]|nr:MAG: hypothetical protein DRI24_18960 [Deltaproteobacteria bacterium]
MIFLFMLSLFLYLCYYFFCIYLRKKSKRLKNLAASLKVEDNPIVAKAGGLQSQGAWGNIQAMALSL